MPDSATKAAWLDAGAVEFQQRGYNATGIAALAARSGALKGSFYNYFPSKEAFALEVIAGYCGAAGLEILAGDAPPDERIRAHFEHLRRELRRRGDAFGCLLGNFAGEVAADNPVIRGAIEAAFDGWAGLLADAIAEAQPDHADSAGPRAQLLIDAWEGALLRAKVTADPAPVEAFLASTLTLVLDA
ncbi:HTH-type transcriptional repressor NemR [Paraconexibacter sp. AEG42_29]|uniref:HTH-type transcriptional repressor NemR n=1 Tax=Paraconexibacter sp. AEG42_29 TaxID=2997339 RepID=A0AAU7AXR5_9ACTN